MLIRVPDYYDEFQCLAGACPHSCCEKWEVVIDEDHVRRYKAEPGSLGEKLRAALRCDEDGDVCFLLDGGRCPFLDRENLCEIHRKLGEEATSVTCQEHPRFTEDYGSFREVTLSASCPAANALLLGTEEPLTFREFETDEPAEEGDAWLEYLLPLRTRLLERLADRSVSLRRRLREFLMLASDAQVYLDEDDLEALPALLQTWRPRESTEDETVVPLFPYALRYLGKLELLEPDWPTLLTQAETAKTKRIPEALLERIAAYMGFRYLLKAVNDGELLSRAQLVVFTVLLVERLTGVCGAYASNSGAKEEVFLESGVAEALRRFSCEIEHSDENLEALLNGFWTEEALSLTSLLWELRE